MVPFQRPVITPGKTRTTKEFWDNIFEGIDAAANAVAPFNLGSRSLNHPSEYVDEVFCSWRKKPDTTIIDYADSGHSFDLVGGTQPVIKDGALRYSTASTGARAFYLTTKSLGAPVSHVKQRFSFTGGSGSGSTSCIAITTQKIDPNTISSGGNTNAMPCHFWTTRNTWAYTIWVPGGVGQVVLDTGDYTTPLSNDVEYEMEAWIDYSTGTATFQVPGGVRKSVTDSRISTYQGQFMFLETVQANAASDPIINHIHFSGSAMRSKPTVQSKPNWYSVKSAESFYADQAVTTTATTFAGTDLDSSIVVPPSGTVVVDVRAYLAITTATTVFLGIQYSGSSGGQVQDVVQTAVSSKVQHARIVLTGLTPGGNLVIKPIVWALANSAATLQISKGAGKGASMTIAPA